MPNNESAIEFSKQLCIANVSCVLTRCSPGALVKVSCVFASCSSGVQVSCVLIGCSCGAGYLSWRSHVWTDVDNNRCGTLPFVFDDDFGFDRYVEYALDVPMYFVYRCASVHKEYSHCCVDRTLLPQCIQT